MERRLVVMRHAQSGRGNNITDHERTLTDRGRREAREIADRLVDTGWTPRLVLSSDATRTRETFEEMASVFDTPPPVVWEESLYLAGVDAAQRALLEHAGDATDVLLLGHNPGWQSLVSYLGGRREQMMTASAALLRTDADSWDETVEPGCFELVQILRPRSL